ncbi:MAG: hypothetical protein F6K19_13610 [Cyanothece sp. SIO1E1]|nr:hypothetical protein [Cyanothece sp. SIO1E1]
MLFRKRSIHYTKQKVIANDGIENRHTSELIEASSDPKPPVHSRWSQRVYVLSLLSFGVSLIWAISGLYSYQVTQVQRLQEAKRKTQREAMLATIEIESQLQAFQRPVLAIANAASAGQLDESELLSQIYTEIEAEPHMVTLGVAYELYAQRQDAMLSAPSYVRTDNQLQRIQLETIFDYTKPQFAWFRQALEQGSHWGEPYTWPENVFRVDPVFGFYSPFYQLKAGEKVPQGVIYAEYALEPLERIMTALNLGKTGYGFLVSKNGVFITHPNKENVKSQTTLIDILQKQNNQQLTNLADQALAGERVETEFIDEITGQKSWLFLQPLEQHGWVVGIVFLEEEVRLDSQTKRRQLIWISLAMMTALLSLSVVGLRAYNGKVNNLWLLSTMVGCLQTAEIIFIWRLALADRNYLSNRSLVLSQAELENLLLPQAKLSNALNQASPLHIPTGVFINTIDFSSPNDIFMTGYIWQIYDTTIHDGLSRGFIMSNVIDGDNANWFEVREAYRSQQGNLEVIGWYFENTLRQDFDFSTYPFDYKDIQIRLLHPDFNHQDLNRQIILVPDLASYKLINPKTNPGVSQQLILDGWDMDGSFFEYQFVDQKTNFGFHNSVIRTNLPELSFTIVLKRQFINPLITRVGPLLLVTILLFALLVIAENDKGLEVLAACSGFLFIVILDQIAVRAEIITSGIVYFEYFYFLIYFYIFLVAINAILLSKPSNHKLVQNLIGYKNNLIPKLLYWPNLLGTLLLITLLVFY